MTSRNLLSLAAIASTGAALIWLFMGEMRTSPASPLASALPPAPPHATRPSDSRQSERDPVASETSRVEEPVKTASAASRAIRPEVAKRESDSSDGFDEGRLTDLAYSPDDIRYIRSLWERSKEDEAAEDDKVGRVAWVPPSQRMAGIRQGLRTDLGDELYDAMLHATDQPNRARVGNVIGSSTAAEAGLRIRDVITRYDGERVFEPADVKRLSEAGEPGKTVALWIRRGDEDIELVVASGPLGVRYFPARETPRPR